LLTVLKIAALLLAPLVFGVATDFAAGAIQKERRAAPPQPGGQDPAGGPHDWVI